MHRLWSAGVAALLLAAPVGAGVVYEIETTDHGASPPRVETTEVSAEGKNLKMSVAPGSSGRTGVAIYRGDRREMVLTDDKDKSYVVMDEAAIQAIAAQVGQMAQQVQEALKNVPQDQRAAVEEMMKQRMPATPEKRAGAELKKTGDRETRSGYPCVRYDVLRGGVKTMELWVTDWSNVEGGDEVRDLFAEMAEFFRGMVDAMGEASGGEASGGAAGGIEDNAFELIDRLDGFPVVTREFEGGELTDESILRSSRRRTLDPSEFEPPAGYKRRSMFSP